MQREQDNVPTGGGEGAGRCQIVDQDVKRAGRRTSWRWRERDGVRSWTRMRREQKDVLPRGGESV